MKIGWRTSPSTPSARKMRWRWATVTTPQATVQLNLRHDSDSEFGGKSTGSVAYGYAITPQWRATASVGTAFRAPTLYHRFSEYGVAAAPRAATTPKWRCAMPRQQHLLGHAVPATA